MIIDLEKRSLTAFLVGVHAVGPLVQNVTYMQADSGANEKAAFVDSDIQTETRIGERWQRQQARLGAISPDAGVG